MKFKSFSELIKLKMGMAKEAVSKKEPEKESVKSEDKASENLVVLTDYKTQRNIQDEVTRLKQQNLLWQQKRDAELKAQRESRQNKESVSSNVQIPNNATSQNLDNANLSKQTELQKRIAFNEKALRGVCQSENRDNAQVANIESSMSQITKNVQKLDDAIMLEKKRIQNASEGKSISSKITKLALDIQNHRNAEIQRYVRMPAIGRASAKSGTKIWLVNTFASGYNYLSNDGEVVSKNSREGDEIRHFVMSGGNPKGFADGATWTNYSVGVKEMLMRFAGNSQKYEFESLRLLIQDLKVDDSKVYQLQVQRVKLDKELKDLQKKLVETRKRLASYSGSKSLYTKRIEDDKRELAALERNNNEQEIKRLEQLRKQQEEESKKREEEERLQREEEERLRREAEEKELKMKRIQEEAEALLKGIEEKKEKIRTARSFIREENALRSQHLLDDSQECAKRSHFFDGKTVVIEGGPGTGKTTTLIQRIKFLLAPEAFEDYETPLTKQQQEELLDPNTIDLKWLFISPNSQLLQYLRNNMNNEGLRANSNSTKSIDKLRLDMFNEYGLDKSFKYYEYDEDEEYEPLIVDGMATVSGFEQYVVENLNTTLQKVVNFDSSLYIWDDWAVRIRNRIINSKIACIDDAISLFAQIEESEYEKVKSIERAVDKALNAFAVILKDKAKERTEAIEIATAMYKRQIDNPMLEDEDIEDGDIDEENEDITARLSFEEYLFKQAKSIVRIMAMKTFDSKTSVPKKLHDLYSALEDTMDIENLASLANDMLFVKIYATLCKGVGVNIFSQISRMYKAFRKAAVKSNDIYDVELLAEFIEMDSNKTMHQDELDLLIGFINGVLNRMHKVSKKRFNGIRHRYKEAYIENVRPIIAVDEATDYTWLDYYLIASLRHYDYCSFSLCGDIMQGLNSSGLKDWNQLESVIGEKPVVVELTTSYRQLPLLVEMSKSMYYDELGKEAPYSSNKAKSENDPKPLMLVSDESAKKAEWIARRLFEIHRQYDNHMPSVAIFVGDEVNVKRFIKQMKEYKKFLNGIKIEDCTDNRQAEGSDIVRVFNLHEVKGMEFEVAIFYDLDVALANADPCVMRRYLYVGISRATTHLAATFSKEKGNEDIIKYFDRDAENWQ